MPALAPRSDPKRKSPVFRPSSISLDPSYKQEKLFVLRKLGRVLVRVRLESVRATTATEVDRLPVVFRLLSGIDRLAADGALILHREALAQLREHGFKLLGIRGLLKLRLALFATEADFRACELNDCLIVDLATTERATDLSDLSR